MKKLIILPFLIGLTACSSNDKYWIGNWAFFDEGLNEAFPYTEMYFDDTSYVVRNENYLVALALYKVSNDSLYRLDNENQVLLGKMELISDSSMRVIQSDHDTLHFLKIPIKNERDKEFKPFGSKDVVHAFLAGYEKRAEEFYIKSGKFKTMDEYKDYLRSIQADSSDEELIDIPETK